MWSIPSIPLLMRRIQQLETELDYRRWLVLRLSLFVSMALLVANLGLLVVVYLRQSEINIQLNDQQGKILALTEENEKTKQQSLDTHRTIVEWWGVDSRNLLRKVDERLDAHEREQHDEN